MSEQNDNEPRGQPLCAACGGIRRLLATLPSTAEQPYLHIFECIGCGIIDCVRVADGA